MHTSFSMYPLVLRCSGGAAFIFVVTALLWGKARAAPSDAEADEVVTEPATAQPITGSLGAALPPEPPTQNRLPSLRPDTLGTGKWAGNKVFARAKRELRIALKTEDKDGDRVQLTVTKLPHGAKLLPSGKELEWSPSPEDVGTYELRVELSDGIDTVEQLLLVVVLANSPPTLVAPFAALSAERDIKMDFARDVNGDALSFVVIRAPAGAKLKPYDGQLTVFWTPTREQIGEHELVVDVSDDADTVRLSMTVHVVPTWGSSLQHHMIPELGAASFVKHDGSAAVGGSFGVAIVTVRRGLAAALHCEANQVSKDCSASHTQLYAQMEVLESTNGSATRLFTYAMGYSSSFETVAARRWLIPIWGAEIGGIASPETDHLIATRPYLGALLWADDTVWLKAFAGYRFVAMNLPAHSGASFGLSALIAPW